TALIAPTIAAAGWAGYSGYRSAQGGEACGAPVTLTDQNGGTITDEAVPAATSAAFLGFTQCPAVCPTTLHELSVWPEELGDEAAAVQAYFVTVEPERDTPEVMKDYVSSFSDRITGITGEPEAVAQMLKDFGIYSRRIETSDGDYTMDHT